MALWTLILNKLGSFSNNGVAAIAQLQGFWYILPLISVFESSRYEDAYVFSENQISIEKKLIMYVLLL